MPIRHAFFSCQLLCSRGPRARIDACGARAAAMSAIRGDAMAPRRWQRAREPSPRMGRAFEGSRRETGQLARSMARARLEKAARGAPVQKLLV